MKPEPLCVVMEKRIRKLGFEMEPMEGPRVLPALAGPVAGRRSLPGTSGVAITLRLNAVFMVTTMEDIIGLWPAMLADTGATVLVTVNALRLLRYRYRDGVA